MKDPIRVESGTPVVPSHANWMATAQRQPADGQKVEVKTLLGIEQTGTFRTAPTMHWEYPHVGLEVFPYWRSLGS
jgi:hypothetical protein